MQANGSAAEAGQALCPLCEQHCPLAAPACPKGRAFAARVMAMATGGADD
jgi:hypothetical protein